MCSEFFTKGVLPEFHTTHALTQAHKYTRSLTKEVPSSTPLHHSRAYDPSDPPTRRNMLYFATAIFALAPAPEAVHPERASMVR